MDFTSFTTTNEKRKISKLVYVRKYRKYYRGFYTKRIEIEKGARKAVSYFQLIHVDRY